MSVLLISSLNLFSCTNFLLFFSSIFYCCYDFICLISVGLTVLWFPKVGASFLQNSCCCGFPSGPCFSLLFYCVVFIATLFIVLLLLFSCSWYFLWSMNYLEMCHIVSSSWIFSHFSPILISILNPYGYRANLYGLNSFKFVEACVVCIGYCSTGIRREYALCCITEMPVESVGWCFHLCSFSGLLFFDLPQEGCQVSGHTCECLFLCPGLSILLHKFCSSVVWCINI